MKKNRFIFIWINLFIIVFGLGKIIDVISTTVNSRAKNIEIEEYLEVEEENIFCSNEIVYEYYYKQLNDIEKDIYNRLYQTVKNMDEEVTFKLNGLTEKDISLIYRLLRYDHPEIYYIQSHKYRIIDNTYVFCPEYIVNKSEIEKYNKKVEDWQNEVFRQLDNSMSSYEKEITVYNYLVDTTKYNIEAENNQSLISVIEGESVCLGYSKAFKYLCDKINIPCIIVEGVSKSGVNHGWNKVKLNDEWYIVDVTNSDTAKIYSNSYDLFNITDELMSLQYNEKDFTSENINIYLPEATSIEEDYYNRKGLYIHSISEIDDILEKYYDTRKIIVRVDKEIDIEEFITYNKNNIHKLNVSSFNCVNVGYLRLVEIDW